MIIIPKGKPIVENLNSFYLDINKMIEHYQGELGAGCVYFASSSDEGLIFFDKDDLLNGVIKNSNSETTGPAAIERIIQTSAYQNFNINIFKIESELVYFWANIPNAKTIHSNLSTEFTDLEKLIKKMSSEKLTGFIDISINKGNEGGFIFFSNGEIIGEFFSGTNGKNNTTNSNLELLFQETKSKGGVFNVSAIPLKPKKNSISTKEPAGSKPLLSVTIIEELLIILENIVASQKKSRIDYHSALKKKFLEKVDKYEFLDPFSAEFKYIDKRIVYEGKSDIGNVIIGVIECVVELAKDLNLSAILATQLSPWSEKYAKEIKALNIAL
jgi:hypothetical protein